jgi:hypothetical protein
MSNEVIMLFCIFVVLLWLSFVLVKILANMKSISRAFYPECNKTANQHDDK